MAEARVLEWEGVVVSPVAGATADEAWPPLSDFLAFHRWNPRVAKCRLAAASPRVVRYCEGTPRDGDASEQEPDWAHETLLEHDAEGRFFRYEMNDNNMGFGAFFATFRVVPRDAGDGRVERDGCELRWEFECEPIRGTPREALVARLQFGLDAMAARVQEHVRAARAAENGVAAAADELNRPDNSIAV
uniref:Coenzyme Q-binding protein COQ10 START domain-containing protein n=1 Tax=Leersia perrieri TaxID=77586 RepID=A0A0D9UXY1_9ORYZ